LSPRLNPFWFEALGGGGGGKGKGGGKFELSAQWCPIFSSVKTKNRKGKKGGKGIPSFTGKKGGKTGGDKLLNKKRRFSTL